MRELKSISKTSVSAIKWSFVKRFDSTDDCIAHLQKNRFISIATSPHTKGKRKSFLDEVDFTVHAKLAVWFGNESRGIGDLAVEHAEQCVSIPMFGMIESLNLGTTSGIVLYEVTKQRRAYQRKYRKRGKRVPVSVHSEMKSTLGSKRPTAMRHTRCLTTPRRRSFARRR